MEINHHQNKNGLQNTKWLQKNKIVHMAIREYLAENKAELHEVKVHYHVLST